MGDATRTILVVGARYADHPTYFGGVPEAGGASGRFETVPQGRESGDRRLLRRETSRTAPEDRLHTKTGRLKGGRAERSRRPRESVECLRGLCERRGRCFIDDGPGGARPRRAAHFTGREFRRPADGDGLPAPRGPDGAPWKEWCGPHDLREERAVRVGAVREQARRRY